MITEALVSLRPGAKWSMNGEDYDQLIWVDTEQTKPSKAEVMAEAERLKIELEKKKFQEQRYYEYPSIRDQLDMLWHAIDTNSLDKSSDFYIKLKEVKDNNPK